jgi:hypothetical protein
VITPLETGTLPSSGYAGGGPANEAKLAREVIDAAYGAFYTGLHAALFLSAFLVFAAELLTLLMFGRQHHPHEDRLVRE